MTDINQTYSNVIAGFDGDFFNINGVRDLAFTQVIDVNTPSAAALDSATDIDSSTSTFTKTDHGFTTGTKVQATTSDALPTGLDLATDYFVIVLTDDTFQLATSLENALAGTNLTISDDGTGTQTLTPVALAGATYNIEVASTDEMLRNDDWVTIGSAVSITTDVSVISTAAQIALIKGHKYMRFVYTITAGRMSISNYIHTYIG